MSYVNRMIETDGDMFVFVDFSSARGRAEICRERPCSILVRFPKDLKSTDLSNFGDFYEQSLSMCLL